MAVNMLMPQLQAAAPMAANDPAMRGVAAPRMAAAGQQATRSAAAMPSPQMSPPPQPKNALLQSLGTAIDGFRRGFDPQGWQQSRDDAKAKQLDQATQTLALMQQQRALPEQQRATWWKQNAPVISQIVGQDVSQMPIDPSKFTDQALDGQIAALSARLGQGPQVPEPMTAYQQEQIKLEREKLAKGQSGDIRQVGKQIVERQADGSWKPVYTAPTEADATRAFATFIDQNSGNQMIMMSDSTVKDTGLQAYIPPQITSVGGVPTGIDKRTFAATPLTDITQVAGNKAAVASADKQGTLQGQAAFDLPGIELRSQAAINSIMDLKGRNIESRFGMQGKLYAIPGTEGADVQALVNQVTSQAFLNAFDQLRGAGAITEKEGQAATAAITRLQDRNISIGEAMISMNELIDYYQRGLEVARQRAVKAPVLPQQAYVGQPDRTPQAGAALMAGSGMRPGTIDLSTLSDEDLARLAEQNGLKY